jgi:hypothetical protein
MDREISCPSGLIDALSTIPAALMPSTYLGEMIMAKSTAVATSAVAPVSIDTIAGFASLDAARETLFDLGSETLSAERLMAQGKNALDVLDANLFDIVKGLNYVEFMKVREFHVAGAVDKLDSVDAAQKRWERQINRVVSGFNFTRPKSENPDAKRKADAKQAEIAKLAEFADDDLLNRRQALISKGDNASLREAMKLGKEVERRNADVIDAQKTELKLMVDKLNTRIKELVKQGDDDALNTLTRALMALA